MRIRSYLHITNCEFAKWRRGLIMLALAQQYRSHSCHCDVKVC
nr:MAG TPA: hypothetical protein [Caudoviricetes sp.]